MVLFNFSLSLHSAGHGARRLQDNHPDHKDKLDEITKKATALSYSYFY